MTNNKAPSRLRYEERNPTISARVPREFKDNLQTHLDRTGQSFSEWIQASFNPESEAVADANEVWERGYADGYDRGVLDALAYLFREGWTEQVNELEYGFMHLDEEVRIDDWYASLEEFIRTLKSMFPRS